jgi:hypothetical protein
MLDDPVADRILRLLHSVGIQVQTTRLVGDTFLSGIRLEQGRLLVDPAGPTHPGDL